MSEALERLRRSVDVTENGTFTEAEDAFDEIVDQMPAILAVLEAVVAKDAVEAEVQRGVDDGFNSSAAWIAKMEIALGKTRDALRAAWANFGKGGGA